MSRSLKAFNKHLTLLPLPLHLRSSSAHPFITSSSFPLFPHHVSFPRFSFSHLRPLSCEFLFLSVWFFTLKFTFLLFWTSGFCFWGFFSYGITVFVFSFLLSTGLLDPWKKFCLDLEFDGICCCGMSPLHAKVKGVFSLSLSFFFRS